MNSEELKKEFGLLMPSEINGFKRPDESISSSNDFFLEIPQLISKDPVLYSTMNLIFSVILSNDKLLKQWHDTLQNVVSAQDWREVTDSLKGYMTPELKKKLDGIANGANNYVHPSSHPASMIAQDATHRFVSDTEKNTWNAKASTAVVSTTANGLMPKRNGNASYIFTGDGVWKSLAWDLITGKPSTFAPSAHNHDSSYLKRNQTTQNDMNACTVEGIYRFSGTLSNAWTGTSWGTLLVFNNQYNGGSGVSGTFLVQIALPTDGRMWTRQRVNTDAWTSWVRVAITTDNVASATKATQDSDGNAINTTYLKRSGGTMGGALNLANNTLNLAGDDCYFGDQDIAGGFCLKGANGTTNLTFINKDNTTQMASLSYAGGNLISNAAIQGNLSGTATSANNLEIVGTSAHIKYGGGDVDENTAISQNIVNLLIGSWYSTGFRDLCSTGNPIRVAINHRNGNIKTTGNVTANGAMYSATPGTSDNSTRVATTAFVQSLINSLSNTVSGLTNAVNKKSQVYIGGGSGTAQQYKDFVIPLPSGYSRSQCKYAVFPTSIVLSRDHGYFSLSVDQSTGIVRGSVRSNITGGGYNYSDIGIGYLVVAVK